MKSESKIHREHKDKNALINMVLYQFLLVATPFLLVRNFLQQAIGNLSQWSYSLGGIRVPYVLSAVTIFFLFLLLINLKRIKLQTILIFIGAVILMGIGQSITDYYFNHDFYELQHNWHYIAYGIFGWVSYLYHKSAGFSYIRYIWRTVVMGQIISIFDETAQIFISGRVFDVCDIGKDFWGMIVGMIVVTAAVSSNLKDYRFRILHRKIREYFLNPYSALFILLLYGFLFLFTGSILTETRYLFYTILWTAGAFITIFGLIHLMQFKVPRLIIILMITGLMVAITITTFNNKRNIVIHKQPGLLNWRGLPVPYFDLMLRDDGTIRLVDKKRYFNKTDKFNRIYGMAEDILLIGAGSKGQGGRGFSEDKVHFVFNPITQRPLQIMVYPNITACRIYNKLMSENKKVLFIIHNS